MTSTTSLTVSALRWPKRIAWIALSIYIAGLGVDRVLWMCGRAEFIWTYDDYRTCGAALSQALMYPAIVPAFFGVYRRSRYWAH